MADNKDAGNNPAAVVNPGGAVAGKFLDLKMLRPEIDRLVLPKFFDRDRDFLEIQPGPGVIDPLAAHALTTITVGDQIVQAVRHAIEARGLATDIAQVTRRLNQLRLSDARRRVLAATYAGTLQTLLDAQQPNPPDPTDILGFSEAVIRDQEKTGGALDKFAGEIVKLVLERTRITVGEVEKGLLVKRVRALELSLKPGQVEPVVRGLLETIIKQGPMPALVERYIDRGEIDRAKFTPAIKRAMVEFLLDRGVQVTDLAKFDAGGYDEHFVVAYERATAIAAAEDDPIDRARQRRDGTFAQAWDFTVDTFDEVEEQGVIKANILAAGAIDYIYELGERMGIFRLADALVLNWASGMIDVVEGNAAQKLYRYWKLRDERSTPEERGMLYKRVISKGNARVLPRMVINEHFPPLWGNLMAEVAKYIEKSEKIDDGGTETSPVSRSGIYQQTKELQYNLTEFCTGMAHAQAEELYAQLQEALDILRDPDIIAHFGGPRRKTLWTVIEQLSKTEFGTSPNIAAVRSLAVDGNKIFQWIANFSEATSTYEEFRGFLDAAESYILNSALIDSSPEAEAEDDFGDGDFGDGQNDDFSDF